MLESWTKGNGKLFRTTADKSYPRSCIEEVFKQPGQEFQFLYASYDSAAVTDFYPQQPTALSPGGYVECSWKFAADAVVTEPVSQKITLKFGTNGKVTWEETVEFFPLTTSEISSVVGQTLSRLVSQCWAQKEIAKLLDDSKDEGPDNTILEISRAYSLVTPRSSFIVLESLAEYVKHEIRPPASLPSVLKAYLEIMEAKKSVRANELDIRMATLTQLWCRKVYQQQTAIVDRRKGPGTLHFLHPGSSEQNWNDPFWESLERGDFLPFMYKKSKKRRRESEVKDSKIVEGISIPDKPERMEVESSGREYPEGGVELVNGEFRREIFLPEDELNYVGLLLGPRGMTKKSIENTSGGTFSIEGSGLVKGSVLKPKEAFRQLSHQFHGMRFFFFSFA